MQDYSAEDNHYRQALAGEGEYWDSFIAQRLRRGEIPGSIDWRLTFTQHRFNHNWQPFCLGAEAANFRMREIRQIISQSTARPNMRVLDLGCGAGWLSLEIARRGGHVTGLDISPTNLALARYMAETNGRNFPFLYQRFAGLPCDLDRMGSVEYLYGDLNTVDLPAGEYDAVVVWDSLHHVADLERLLGQVRLTLKPDGIFIGVDHATPSRRTEIFNRAMLPWLAELQSWLREHGTKQFYAGANAVASEVEWGVLSVDYDPAPVPGFSAFLKDLLAEMLEIVERNVPTKDRAGVPDPAGASLASAGDSESPFEDVSAERVMRVLRQNFKVERFETICPFIRPEPLFPGYRSEEERIFQHYLAALLAGVGERAIARDETDGQWFFFHLAAEPPAKSITAPLAQEYTEMTTFSQHAQLEQELDERLAHLRKVEAALDERLAHHLEVQEYVARLETEIERKNVAIADLQRRIPWAGRQNPILSRMPWKKRDRRQK